MKKGYGKIGVALACALTLGACSAKGSETANRDSLNQDSLNTETTINKNIDMESKDLKTVYLAGGCFWGTEHF